MGGQACVLYGAAEFSRDADFAVLASPENLGRLRGALEALQADVIAVPPFVVDYLAIHQQSARCFDADPSKKREVRRFQRHLAWIGLNRESPRLARSADDFRRVGLARASNLFR